MAFPWAWGPAPRGPNWRPIRNASAGKEYDAFGNIIPNSATGTWIGRFTYQGQSWIEITSSDANKRLLLSPTRIYDPVTGRFLQKDPLYRNTIEALRLYQTAGMLDSFYWEDMNPYIYVGNNPNDRVDPEGLG